ncbi:alanine racemase [Brachyspira pilosicoli]|uniref:Alanine racemase n=1 Tax=Brachyspira pilosicoli TaxID=52584 RepID=A0A5C8EU89_BRAPL|nr:alanine racemase [Brachyspira pilosicoli]TXJ39810.1 alanine racemase [Brachyspira pilosicoli]
MYNIAEIDLKALQNNIKIIRSMIGNTKLLSIVKANAYGHGIVGMSEQLEKLNVDALGVATVEEGVKIREVGIKTSIIVLFQHFRNEAEYVCRYNLTPIISNDECLDDYDRFLKKYNKKLKLHIKVDTGLNRMGAKPKDVLNLAKKVLSYNTLEIEGINTHYAASDTFDNISREFTENQIRVFNEVLNNLKTNGIKINNAHTANSAALLYYKNAYFDMVRAGIVLYGYTEKLHDFGFKPILNLKSKIILTRKIKRNETVSYGMTWKASKDTNIAVVPIGYADGMSRKLSNNWEVKINGKYYPIVGKICMDIMMVDIGNENNIKEEDEVLIFGNDERLNANTMAKKIDSISHEVLVRIGERVKRVYRD